MKLQLTDTRQTNEVAYIKRRSMGKLIPQFASTGACDRFKLGEPCEHEDAIGCNGIRCNDCRIKQTCNNGLIEGIKNNEITISDVKLLLKTVGKHITLTFDEKLLLTGD